MRLFFFFEIGLMFVVQKKTILFFNFLYLGLLIRRRYLNEWWHYIKCNWCDVCGFFFLFSIALISLLVQSSIALHAQFHWKKEINKNNCKQSQKSNFRNCRVVKQQQQYASFIGTVILAQEVCTFSIFFPTLWFFSFAVFRAIVDHI